MQFINTAFAENMNPEEKTTQIGQLLLARICCVGKQAVPSEPFHTRAILFVPLQPEAPFYLLVARPGMLCNPFLKVFQKMNTQIPVSIKQGLTNRKAFQEGATWSL